MSNTHTAIPASAKMVFKGEIFEVWQWEQQMYDGSVATFERLRRANASQVVTLVGDKILIQLQEQPDQPLPFLSLPGGRCEANEDPLIGAKRELLEENGMVSDDWTLWLSHSPSGKIEWTIYTYIARNCREESAPHLDPGEKITARLISFEEFLLLPDDPSFNQPLLSLALLRARYDTIEKEKLYRLLFPTIH